MHSKQRFEICICLVILGHLSVFEIIRAPVLLSRKVYSNWFRYYLTCYESENFSNPSLYRIKGSCVTPKAFDLWSSNDSFACVADAALNLLYRTSRRRTIQMVLTSAWAGCNADSLNVLNLLQLFTSHPSTSQLLLLF